MLKIQANSIPENCNLPVRTGTVQTVIESPPYPVKRIYGDSPLEYGQESMQEYLDRWVLHTREVHRTLKDSGTFWFNVGDKASGSGGAGGDFNSGGFHSKKKKYGKFETHLPDRSWCNIPSLMSIAMQNDKVDGKFLWLLRGEIIWDRSPKLEVCSGDFVKRPKSSYEKIYFFSKNVKSVKEYKFYFSRLKEPGNVWHFPPTTEKKGHDAPFPDELAERCILPSTDKGDLVADYFGGSHTTARVAEKFDRKGISIELYA